MARVGLDDSPNAWAVGHHGSMRSREAPVVRRSEVMLADIPDDLDDAAVEKASGVVRLPFHLDWSTPGAGHDLDDPETRAHVYGKVIREGLAEDLRHYIDVDWLIKLWPRVGVPRTHTEAWIDWVREHRGVELPNRFA
jgi:hypothetical protein